jgi:16S rRNA (cytidine1402-2'-O)-methyltransferase
VALVSDAGTPLISDPGFRLVQKAIAEGVKVVPIPGASAILTALTASGLPTDQFYFGGFLPPRGSPRKRALEEAKKLPGPLVFYEAPHRILESVEDITAILGQRQLVLTRELTKMHEEFLRGTGTEILEELRRRPSIKGEFTIVVGRAVASEAEPAGTIPEAVEARVVGGLSRMDAIKAVARERGLSKREVYAAVEADEGKA